MNAMNASRQSLADLIPAVAAAGGVIMHLWAGWIDDAHFHLVPRGHGAVIAVYAWILAGLVAMAALAATKGHSRWAAVSLTIAVLGAGLVVIPALLYRP